MLYTLFFFFSEESSTVNLQELTSDLFFQVEQQDRVLSSSEDPLPFLHNSKADPVIRSRPLSDIYPLHSQGDRKYLLSGCGAQVQPVTSGSEENKLNGINSTAWSNPVIGHPEGKPYSSRIMRLFSNSRKGPVPAHSPSTDSPASSNSSGSDSGPQSWSGLSGLAVVDSFKKLRSSVLQGIQSRGTISQEGELDLCLNQEVKNGVLRVNTSPGLNDATNHFKFAEGSSVSNGGHAGQKLAVMCQCGSDIEDYDDEEADEGDSFTRNTRFSRSIRRAYGAGRISLYDMGNGRPAGKSTNEAEGQKPEPTSKDNSHMKNTNVKVLSRLSKSAENLHIFKAPFRRKAAPLPQEDSQKDCTSNGAPSIQRTASASSMDLAIRKTPVKTKKPVLKLVSSMTDLTVRRRRSPSPSPTTPSPMSPLSQLHDNYSRRVPFQTTSERQRRPSPVRARVMSAEHSPPGQSQPDVGPQQHQVLISPVPVETSPGVSAHYELLSDPLSQTEPSQQQEETEVNVIPNEVKKRI